MGNWVARFDRRSWFLNEFNSTVARVFDCLDELLRLPVVGVVERGADLLRPRQDLGGIEATARIKSAHPGMKVLILTMHREKEYLRVAFSAGADGYLLKEDAGVELFPAIEMIRRGEVYISPVLREML